MKTIKKVVNSAKVNMGGIILEQPMPNRHIETVDPFLLIHHWENKLKGNQKQQDAGVGPHPHRGFSPITVIYKGGVHHRDSRGNDSIVKAGGVQWMFAGQGITHSERPPKELAEQGGDFEIIQFWLNVPAKNKMEQPIYTPKQKDEIPTIKLEDNGGDIQIVSGEINGVKGDIDHFSPVTIANFLLNEGAEFQFSLTKNHNTVLYVLDGILKVNGKQVFDKQLVEFNNDGETIELIAQKGARALLLSGEPLNEKVAQYGPFVMNNQTEIMQAMRDAQMGKMGVLIEEF